MLTPIGPVVCTISVAVARWFASARLCAVTWYVPLDCGATMVPSSFAMYSALQQSEKCTRLSVVPVTVAVNLTVAPGAAAICDGSMVTWTPFDVVMIIAIAFADGSATLVTVTCAVPAAAGVKR